MKLLIVTNVFHPDRGGGASVFSDLAYGLAERGHDVNVYTAYPYYPEWTNKSGANPWRIKTEQINGVSVTRFGMFIPSNPSRFVARIVFELSFTLSLLRSLFFFKRYDAVMVYCPLLGSVAYASVRRILYREPLWLNVQDIPADAASAAGISKNRFTDGLGQAAQRWLFNRADVWSTIAPGMVRRLEELRGRGQPVHLAPNFLNQSMADAVDEHPPKLGRPVSEPIKLLYGGNIGKKQGLIDFCARLAATDLDFEFTIHGNGAEASALEAWVDSAGDSRFRFGEFLDEKGFVNALFECDLFVITEKSGAGASFIPSKLIPCLASGTPVLAVCDEAGPLGAEVAAHGLGLMSEWDGLAALLDELGHLSDDPSGYEKLQQAALERAKSYHRSSVIGLIERELSVGLLDGH